MKEADYLVGVLTEDEQFSYDKLGNRESVNLRDGSDEDYAVNYLTNRYDNDQGEDIVCDYDAAGNTIVDPKGYQYSYDYENRIIEIKDKDNTSVVEYAYDALGRRIEKDDKIAGEKTRYYYNNNWQVLKETDDNDATQRWYIYGNYIDEVLVMVAPNEPNDYYYAHNHLHSPVALIDDEGDVLERYEYDAYGKPYFMEPNFVLLNEQKSVFNNPIQFTGRRVDILDSGNIKLGYNRTRYLDYYTGRWLTHDHFGMSQNPLGVNGFVIIIQYINGQNLYQYVYSNPMVYCDIYGYGLWSEIKALAQKVWDETSGVRGVVGVVLIPIGLVAIGPNPIIGGAIVAGGIFLTISDFLDWWETPEGVVGSIKDDVDKVRELEDYYSTDPYKDKEEDDFPYPLEIFY